MDTKPTGPHTKRLSIILSMAGLAGIAVSLWIVDKPWINDYVKASVILPSFISFIAGLVMLYQCRIWPFH